MIDFPLVVYSTAIVSPSMITADSTGEDMSKNTLHSLIIHYM